MKNENRLHRSHVLDNGFTFLAVTSNWPGNWAKAKDPISAMLNAVDEHNGEQVVRVIYAKNETVWVDEMGSMTYSIEEPPVPIGLFIVKKGGRIRPVTEKDKCSSTSEEWINEFNSDLQQQIEG